MASTPDRVASACCDECGSFDLHAKVHVSCEDHYEVIFQALDPSQLSDPEDYWDVVNEEGLDVPISAPSWGDTGESSTVSVRLEDAWCRECGSSLSEQVIESLIRFVHETVVANEYSWEPFSGGEGPEASQ